VSGEPCLLDVNLLVALFWPLHRFHEAAQKWFSHASRHGWATCPFTQAGFIRIISNPAVTAGAVTVEQAVQTLCDNLDHRHHRFWPAEIGYPQALEILGIPLGNHRQVTDAYLLALAIHHQGKLATLDRALQSLLPAKHPHGHAVELVLPT
jgi:toxin-antitoxin system PIN domain toxin